MLRHAESRISNSGFTGPRDEEAAGERISVLDIDKIRLVEKNKK